MMSAMMAIINPGDEIVVLSNPSTKLRPRRYPLRRHRRASSNRRPPANEDSTWSFDGRGIGRRLRSATPRPSSSTRPTIPPEKFSLARNLEFIRDLCVRWNAFCITDEIYEHILYDATEHISMARIDGMRDRSPSSSMACTKTYSVTGWRVGWALAPPETTQAIRKVHDFLTVGAAAHLQQAGALALKSHAVLLRQTRRHLRHQARSCLLKSSPPPAFTVYKPRGASLHHDDISHFPFRRRQNIPPSPRDRLLRQILVEKKIGVACVPGSSFYNNAQDGASQVRFTFCKKEETLAAAEALASRNCTP